MGPITPAEDDQKLDLLKGGNTRKQMPPLFPQDSRDRTAINSHLQPNRN